MQLWRINENDVSPVDLDTFESEKELQDLIERNPEILPIDADLMILAREFQCGAGVADFVAVDMRTGQLVIVETKLYRNGDRRRVVAQVLDYAADMFDQDLEYLESRVRASVWAELDDAALDVLADSLRSGDFRLVVVMDRVDGNTKKVARYFQSAGVRFQIDLVTVVKIDVQGEVLAATKKEDVSAGRPSDLGTAEQVGSSIPRPRKVTTDVLAQMFDLQALGHNQAEIALALDVSSATVSRRLRGRSR